MARVPFRARARTVDHLGREQIADCPTAVSELWKNAYDAYARSASLHLFGGDVPVAAVVDDGHGMSMEEFIERWLMLGTEAKVGKDDVSDADRHGLPLRPLQGQKGIGRLSVAYLGPTVLVLTKRTGGTFVVALLDWRLFQNPYLALDDVRIPVEEFENTSEFPDIMSQLFDGIVDNVWGRSDEPERQRRLESAWLRFSADEIRRGEASTAEQIASLALLGQLEDEHLRTWPAWTGEADHGTAMFVLDMVRELRIWVELGTLIGDPEVQSVQQQLRFTLTGFTDPFGGDATDFQYRVISHIGRSPKIVLSSSMTFDLTDLRDLEHVVEGQFDGVGVFSGSVRAWGKDLGNVVITPPRPPPGRGRGYVGPFAISFGTFEQEGKSSTHTAAVITRLKEQAKVFSGLAVYRDGLRVQPYGRPENDFFKIEERRSKHAGREFWASRRMFGRVAITREKNAHLRDKAGREGLIDNQAAREFRILVIDVLMTLARRYFGSDSDIRDVELEEASARHERAKSAENSARRQRVTTLKRALKENAPVLATTLIDARALTARLADRESVLDLEEEATNVSLLHERRSKLAPPPRPRKLTDVVEENYRSFRDTYAELTAVVEAASTHWAKRAADESQASSEETARSALGRHQKFITDATSRWKKAISGALSGEESRWSDRVRVDNARYYRLAAPLLDDLAGKRIALASTLAEMERLREQVYGQLVPEYEGYLRAVDALREGIDIDAALSWATDERAVLFAQVEQWQDLAQLGITVEIVGHELNETAAQVSRNLLRLPSDARATTAFKRAHTGFRALVQRLEFIAPLRLSGPRTRRPISGRDLYHYLRDFFEPQLRERKVELVATPAFLSASITEFPHRVYPVFVNLVNNALYWVTFKETREILLDRRGDEIYVADTGPGVDPDDEENLFGLFFTRRVGGHGVGLYLSRIALEQGRHKIRLASSAERILPGANFIIAFRDLQDGG